MFAVRAARAVTGRPKLLMFDGAYHGTWDAVMPGTPGVDNPDTLVGAFNDVPGVRALVRAHAHELACVLVEPFLGAGGVVPADERFLRMLREETLDAGALLVYDEVTSLRCGHGGLAATWGHAHDPDLTVVGKLVGGGFPIGVLGGRQDVMRVFTPGASPQVYHSGSFNGFEVACAAGLEALALYDSACVAETCAKGERLAVLLQAAVRDAGLRAQVQHVGPVLHLHFTERRIAAHADVATAAPLAPLLHKLLLLDGVMTAPRQMYWVSAVHSEPQLAQLAASVGRALARLRPLVEARFPRLLRCGH
jgi:glutamate-1-semialdehyde 2,1-aminomutase